MKISRQSGFTIVEMLIVLVIIAMLMPSVYDLWRSNFIAFQQGLAADQMRQVNEAANAYVKRNFETLLSSATPSSGPQISIQNLIDDDLLPDGFRNSNIWGQSYEIYVRSPHENTLNTITITRGGREHEEGDSFATLTVPGAALQLGGAGGFVPTGALPGQTDGTLHGTAGGFILDLAALGIASPGPGHLGAYSAFDEYDLGTDYLYRSEVPGHPEYNQMETSLDMTGHDIENVGSIQYVSRTISDDDSCSDEDEGKMFLDEDSRACISAGITSSSSSLIPATPRNLRPPPSSTTATRLPNPHALPAPAQFLKSTSPRQSSLPENSPPAWRPSRHGRHPYPIPNGRYIFES